MDPVYKSMHSFPYHVDQTHFGPYYLPGFEAAPTQMCVNPLRPQFNNECWPWGSKSCFAYPAAYHGCCSHNYVPNHYSWSSPYSHVPPVQGAGSCHSFPIQYMPSLHYPIARPQYEYEKHVQRDHNCCGCPNHLCHQKEEQNVNIEEEAKNGERIRLDSQDPFQLSKCPYPILWLPPNDRSRKEHLKTNPLDCRNLEEDSNDAKSYKNQNTFEHLPAVWNGWYPYDLNNFESFKKKGDDQHQQDEYKGHFPFPVFWMPYKPEEKESLEHKENNANPEPRSELVKHSDGERNNNGNGERADDQASLKAKSILSKEENEILRNNEKESKPVKVTVNNADKKFARDDSEKNSSSPKSSKLPPVCLRVEPLTMRKNTNGRSRSLSPPGGKQKSDKMSYEPSEAVSLTGSRKTDMITNGELMKGKGITKTIEVVDGKSLQGESVEVEVRTPVNLSLNCQGRISTKERNIYGECTENDTAVVKRQSEDAGSVKGEIAEIQTKEDEADKRTKTKLSSEEAAIIIQSAYRGFNIRRWEPVKKLKQIAEVREQMAVVNNLIQEMELSSDTKSNNKHRNIIAETIMSLLLKLDTIQGLHQSIREVRKSAVRELVNLQEKLDSLINENSEASPGLYSSPGMDVDAQDVLATHIGNETYPDLENVAAEIPENCVTEVTELTSESTMKNEDEQIHKVQEDVKVSFSTSNLLLNSDSGESDASNGSMSDKALDKPLEMKIPSQQARECHLEQEFGPINDLANFDEASDIIGTEVVERKYECDGLDPDKSSDKQESAISNIKNHIDVADAQEHHLEQEISIIDDLANIEGGSDMIGTEVAEGKPSHDGIDSDKSSDQQESAINNHIDVIDALECCLEPEISLIDDLANIDGASHMIGTEVVVVKPAHDGIDSVKSSDQQENAIDNHIDVIDVLECCLEPEINLIDDLANIDEASDMIGVEVGVGKYEHDGIDLDKSSHQQEIAMVNIDNHQTDIIDEREWEPRVVDIDHPLHEICENENGGTVSTTLKMEMLSEHTQDCNQKHLLVKENFEVQGLESLNGNQEDAAIDVLNHTEIKYAVDTEAICQVNEPLSKVSLASDEMTKSNTNLIEENERLRDVMEKLIKSGQEQLSAISILSGRVKALEKRLSRKKKLKTKRCRKPISESSALDTL